MVLCFREMRGETLAFLSLWILGFMHNLVPSGLVTKMLQFLRLNMMAKSSKPVDEGSSKEGREGISGGRTLLSGKDLEGEGKVG
jgi:hypothetical protein